MTVIETIFVWFSLVGGFAYSSNIIFNFFSDISSNRRNKRVTDKLVGIAKERNERNERKKEVLDEVAGIIPLKSDIKEDVNSFEIKDGESTSQAVKRINKEFIDFASNNDIDLFMIVGVDNQAAALVCGKKDDLESLIASSLSNKKEIRNIIDNAIDLVDSNDRQIKGPLMDKIKPGMSNDDIDNILKDLLGKSGIKINDDEPDED